MRIRQELAKLEKVVKEGNNKVFTMYLNTDPSDPDQQGGEWKIHLKNGLHNFEKYLQESNNKEELKNFQAVKKKVESYVFEHEQFLKRSVVLFATADEDVWFAERLQIRVKSEFFWEQTPELNQLKAIAEKYPRSGILLVHHHTVHVLEAYLNQLTTLKSYEMDVETDDWKEKVAPRQPFHSSGLGSHNAQVDNFEARFKANQHRWFNSIAGKIDKVAKEEEWRQIHIVGETEVAHELEKSMNKKVNQVIPKNIYAQKENQILEAVFGQVS